MKSLSSNERHQEIIRTFAHIPDNTRGVLIGGNKRYYLPTFIIHLHKKSWNFTF